ncbi:Streptogramin A acetyltransferase [compost metagenome]
METRDFAEFSTIAGSVTLQPHATLEHPVHLSPQAEIHNGSAIGRCSFLNVRSIVYSDVSIGRYCSIGRNCELGVSAHPTSFLSSHSFQYNTSLFPAWEAYSDLERVSPFTSDAKTIIGNDVWIGAQSIVIAGVNIGDGAIVAANSVVTRDVAPYEIVGGSPAKLISMRFNDDIISALKQLKWWNFPLERLSGVPFHDVNEAIAKLRL